MSSRVWPSLGLQLKGPRDPLFVEAAWSGELAVARVRLLVLCLLLLIQAAPGADPDFRRVSLPLSLVGLALALGIYAAVWRGYRSWMGFLSSALDVSLVTAGLAAFLLEGHHHMALINALIFDGYFLALAASCLRYDWRVCATTGLLAVSGYGTLMLTTLAEGGLDDPRYDAFTYGAVRLNHQLARLVLLACASLIATFAALRMQRLRWLSGTDRLTGLRNRGVFEERLVEELARARRAGQPLAVALLDIDGFKAFNDTHGHAGGDAALRTVADCLRHSVRQSDVLARHGGEEFAVLFPETSGEEALLRLDAIRAEVAAMPLRLAWKPRPLRLSFSGGVAAWPADGGDPGTLLCRADERLYDAKRRGRNCIVGPEGRTLETAPG
jgi:diguanylate cyclase (GGDEF)-like protein